MKRFRVVLGLVAAVAAAAVAIAAGGWAPIMLGLLAGVILSDALVPDFHTPLFGEQLPESKRPRARRR
jgi:hypothetical protein